MVNFDKFLASFITEMKKYTPITSYNIPGCIKKALEDQGLEYKNGEIVKIQSKVSAESEDEKIRQFLTHAWLEKQGDHQKFCDSIQVGDRVTRNEDGVLVNLGQLKRVAKPACEVKPKFKVGDWVVDEDDNSVHQIKRAIENVTSGELSYDLVGGGYFPSTKKNYHLWTIQDAKDGDVLACDDKDKVFLYNGKLDLRGRVCAYCGIYKTYDGLRFTKCAIGNYFTYKEPYPATKEQRDILFQKMYEAGYTFNFEKKKLKKLKFKVGDEVITENEGSLTITKIDEEGYWSNDLFICDFDSECVWDLVEQKSNWSEEELATIELIEDHAYFAGSENTREKLTEKACEYISKHQCEYIDLDDFRKAMEK